jgi:glycogen debranching enzyme
VLAALEELGRYPELYAVTDARPERIPIANQVQAWSVGASFALRERWDGRVAGLL